MSKKLKPKRVSSLGGLRSPEEITESVEELTTTPSTVVKKEKTPQPVAVKRKTINKSKSNPPIKPKAKKENDTSKEIVKFIKMEDEHHMAAKIAATKKRMSIKAYLEGLVRKDNPDMF